MKSVKTSGFTANGSSTSLPSYIFKSSQSHATFVHTLFALVDPEDSWPLIHRRKVRRISLIDIKESLVFVPSVEKVYKDVSIVKEANTFIPHIKEMCLKVTWSNHSFFFKGCFGTNLNNDDPGSSFAMKENEDFCGFGF
uniref:Uncharacterized protein n=1 Tax=Populus alba TaxID=43335 RepID=A0A4U5QFH8_POPAL|nr:hypothetical protein D5086_0000094110 [Populus alba]